MKLVARLVLRFRKQKERHCIPKEEWLWHLLPREQKPLYWGCVYGHYYLVEYLLSCGCDLHLRDEFPLHLAIHNDHMDIVILLIHNGANVNAYDGYALRRASSHGQLDIVKFLIKNGAYVGSCDNAPIRLARKNGHYSVVRYLEKQYGGDMMMSSLFQMWKCLRFPAEEFNNTRVYAK